MLEDAATRLTSSRSKFTSDIGASLVLFKMRQGKHRGSLFCAGCGASVGAVQPPKKKRAFGDAIGMLDFADGGLKCFLALVVAYGIINQLSEHDYEFLAGALFLMAVAAILGILAIVGGIFPLRGKSWAMALTGAIAAALTPSLLGVAALVLMVMARDEFERQPESR